MPEYANQSFAGKTLVIAPLDRSPIIDNPSDVADDIGEGITEDVYADFFAMTFPDSLQVASAFANVTMGTYEEEPMLASQGLDLEKGAQMGMNLPTAGTTVQFETEVADVVLFIEDLRTERTSGSGPTVQPGGGMAGGTTPKLRHALEYAYWDNVNGRVISYGKLSVDTNFFIKMGLSTWRTALGRVARSSVRGGPLAR